MAGLTSQSIERFTDNGCYTPQVVVDIEGYPIFYTGCELNIDPRKTNNTVPVSYNKIDFAGSDSSISQQLQLEKGGSSSTTTYRFRLVDIDQTFTKLFSFNATGVEILEKPARVYFGFEDPNSEFPRDYTPLINGTVGKISMGCGWIELDINHPDKIRKQEIFLPSSAESQAAFPIGSTTITLDTTEGFLEPTIDLRTYFRINDELVEYTGVTPTSLTGLTRASFDTLEDNHDADIEIQSFYQLAGDTFTIALRMMLSGSGVSSPETVLAIGDDGITSIPNAVFFACNDIREIIGATIGDKFSLTSITDPGNDVVDATIIGYGTSGDNSYYVLDTPLTNELAPTASATAQSQYDVWPDGCGLMMHQIDVPEFDRIRNLFSARVLDFDFFLKEEVSVSSFINQELYLPSSFYHLPRKGKNSIGVFNPPLTSLDTVRANSKTVEVKSASKIVVRRSTGKNFYNYVQYKFNEDTIDDRLLDSVINFSADSVARIPTRNKGIKIESRGLRRTPVSMQRIQANSNFVLERYRFGAEDLDVTMLFKDSFNVELGDPVIFGDSLLQASDSSRGDRNFKPRIMQVVNKRLNLLSGKSSFTLLDTSYSITARYGTISPASSVTSIMPDGSFKTAPAIACTTESEFDTWCRFIGKTLKVCLPDCAFDQEVILTGVTDDGCLKFDGTLSLPTFPVDNGLDFCLNKQFTESDLTIKVASYGDGTDSSFNQEIKDTYTFLNAEIEILAGIDGISFTVNPADLPYIQEGSSIQIWKGDNSDISLEGMISTVSSNVVTLSIPASFIPAAGDKLRLLYFPDGGFPYRIF